MSSPRRSRTSMRQAAKNRSAGRTSRRSGQGEEICGRSRAEIHRGPPQAFFILRRNRGLPQCSDGRSPWPRTHWISGQRVVRACDSGMPAAAVAARFDVSLAWVYRLVQRRRETGSIAPRTANEVSWPRLVERRGGPAGRADHGPARCDARRVAARPADARGAEHAVADD